MAILIAMFARIERRSRAWILTSAVLLGTPGILTAQSGQVSEYELKAVFLFNFVQFVEWPPEAFSGAQAPLVIGVMGDDPFGRVLDETVSGETVRQRPLQIRRYRGIDEITTCHLLFISESEAEQLDEILAALKDRSILTVSDDESFTRRGGVIRFVVDRSKIRFQINLEAAQAARLTVSSKLLRLAEIVGSGGR